LEAIFIWLTILILMVNVKIRYQARQIKLTFL
jgi:hypothetical protein